jgi:hypothetical protein
MTGEKRHIEPEVHHIASKQDDVGTKKRHIRRKQNDIDPKVHAIDPKEDDIRPEVNDINLKRNDMRPEDRHNDTKDRNIEMSYPDMKKGRRDIDPIEVALPLEEWVSERRRNRTDAEHRGTAAKSSRAARVAPSACEKQSGSLTRRVPALTMHGTPTRGRCGVSVNSAALAVRY